MGESGRAAATSRRSLLKRGVLLGAAGIAVGTGGRRSAGAGLSGKITIGYAADPIRAPYVAKAAVELKAANPQAEIKVNADQTSGAQYLVKLLLALRSGNAPDVFLADGIALGALAAGGALAPLDDYVNAWPDWAMYPKSVRDAIVYQGKVWAIPFGLDTQFLYYRRDLFQQAGLAADWQPANIGGILEAAQAVKAKVPDVIPYALYAGQNPGFATAVRGFVPILYAYGGSYKDANGKWIIDSCPVRDTLDYYVAAFQKDRVVPQQVVTTPNVEAAMRAKLAQGELALLLDGTWAYGPWVKDNPKATEQIGHLLFPTAKGGPSFTAGAPGDVWFISAGAKDKDLAWEFVKAWNNRETVVAVCTAEPRPPARTDALEALVAAGPGFVADVAKSLPVARFSPPDPNYQEIISVLYDVTGSIATGEESAASAVKRYTVNLERVLGASDVVRQPCS